MIQNNIASSDFRNRYEAVSELTELLLKDKQTCLPKANYFVDLYVGRLADNNSKVAAAALQGVDKLVASYGSALESSLGLLVPALAANLSNTSPQLRSLASGVMESLCSRLDPGALVQPLAAAVDFGNQRAKAALLDKMRGLVSKVVDKKPQLLHKFFVASAVKSLDDHKADVRGANNLLIKELYTVLGDSILSGNPRLPERQLTRLKEVIASQTPAQPSLAGLSIH